MLDVNLEINEFSLKIILRGAKWKRQSLPVLTNTQDQRQRSNFWW
jgi:hypothetical protein